jgi:hypothetical protein
LRARLIAARELLDRLVETLLREETVSSEALATILGPRGEPGASAGTAYLDGTTKN